MATAKNQSNKKLTWQALGEMLSEAGVLMADEEISQITLTKPRCLLLHTFRVKKLKKVEEE